MYKLVTCPGLSSGLITVKNLTAVSFNLTLLNSTWVCFWNGANTKQ